jgi:transposase
MRKPSSKRPGTAGRQLNRKQRKELKRRLHSENPGLEVVHPNAAGIDIGNESHFVAVPPDRDEQPVREFLCFTTDLHAMAQWLKSCGIQTVAMQSTGVYWMAVYDVLEQYGLDVFLVNARHTRNLPGRKSDVQECQWLMKLHTFGLLQNSFRPAEQIRRVRAVWRLRERHVDEVSRSIQHMQKALTTMNLQLANVISDVTGQTGLAILRAIAVGERDAERLAKHRDPRIKASQEEIVASLQGHWDEGALFELQQALDAYDFYRRQIVECDAKLQQCLEALPDGARPQAEGEDQGGPEAASKAITATDGKSHKKKRRGGRNKNLPSFDVASELKRIYSVDLTRIDGIDVMKSQTILAELGTDFSHWPTEDHFASWLQLCPRKDISGGKVLRHVPDNGKNRVAAALRMAASTLLRSRSYLGAKYRTLRMRLGAAKAVKAMARHLACLVYRLITRGQEYVDRGQQAYEEQHTARQIHILQRKAAILGLALVPQAEARL